MFETERIILKKAKKTPKKNNNIKNKLLFKTQENKETKETKETNNEKENAIEINGFNYFNNDNQINGTKSFLFDNDNFKVIEEVSSTIVAATPSTGSNNVKLTVIGDSIVNGAFFYDAFFTKNYAPNCSFVGLRSIRGQQSQYDEGRGGWSLSLYFKIVPEDPYFFNPFMQPDGNYHFWGSKQFWKNACDVASGIIPIVGSTEPGYSCGRYGDYVSRFDSSTGLLANPQSGDIMYDLANSKFILYNGSSWEDTDKDSYTWTFNYAKYFCFYIS